MDYQLNDNTIKEEIRSRLDIVAVVGRYVTLKPAGSNMKGLCPFHKEKSPSFMVSPDKGIFRCFGCGKGGDVFNFLMEIEGIGFGEVLRMTAEETGVKLERPSYTPPPDTGGSTTDTTITKTELLRINTLAAGWFYTQMRESRSAIDYFQSRGLTGQTVKEFTLGWAPEGWSNLITYAAKQGISAAALTTCGLAIAKENGSAYDRFRNRVIFPLFDMTGKVIGFAGRGMEKDAQPKYLNSPETLLYHKSKTLYGLHKARPYIKECGFVAILEGYMDYLTLYQAEIRNCVATSGTALTQDHAQIIRRFTNRVVLLFDGDAAGVSAAERGLMVLVPQNIDVRVCLLPPEHDPDSFVRAKGATAMRTMLDNARDATGFLLDHAIRRWGSDTPQAKSQVARYMIGLVNAMSDPIAVDAAVKTISERLGLSERLVRQETGRQKPGAEPIATAPSADAKDWGTPEFHFLALLLHHPRLIEVAMERISPETLNDQFSKNLYSIILKAFAVDTTLRSVLDQTANVEARQALARLMLNQPGPLENAEGDLSHTIVRLKLKALKKKMREIKTLQKMTRDPAVIVELQQELLRIMANIKELDG
jgi:DNA primase